MNTAIEFGSVLRDARKRRGLALQELANNTKIAASVLRGLEDGSVDRLPGGLYSRAFIRAYAREVGLDPDEMVEEFLKAVPRAHDDFGLNSTHVKSTLGRLLNPPIIIATAVLAGVIVGVFWSLLGSGTVQSTLISEDIEPPGVSLSMQQPLPNAPVVSTTEDTSFSLPGRGFTVSVHPTGPCWVSLTIDGGRIFARVMTAGERESFEVDNRLVLNVGDAGAFEFSINEDLGRSLGGDGQVVTVELNRANHQSFISQP